jgi:large subunit ribosomal protein L21
MYAVIASGGKQQRVEVGETIEVELLKAEVGEEVNFAAVLLVDGENITAGTGKLDGAAVSGRVVGESKGPKIDAYNYKSKTRGRRRWGHRQHYTTVEITSISPAN